MVERSLRGMGIGAKSLESDKNVDFAKRKEIVYVCEKGHRTIVPLAENAEVPKSWECWCGAIAVEEATNNEDVLEPGKPQRTHWDMLLERRTPEELDALLEKRLKMKAEGWFPDYEQPIYE